MQHTGLIAYAYYKKGRIGLVLLYFVAALFFPNTTCGQEPPRRDIDINQFVAELFPVPSEDTDYSELFESLLHLYTNPPDINSVTADDLSGTLVLTDQQVRALLSYREQVGPFLSLYELQAVPGYDLFTINRLLPFITLNPKPVSIRDALKSPGQHFLMFRTGRILEMQKGFSAQDSSSKSAARYAGNPYNAYLRYRNARTGSYSFGFTMDKDAGEELWTWKSSRHIFGADFTSFHAQVMNRGRWKNLVLGDYQMQAGQGMVLGAGFSLGKGSEVIKTGYRSTLGFKPYTSSGEALFFRGAAGTYAVSKHTDISLFYSKTKRDATIQESTGEKPVVTSLPINGYHRTSSEIEKHNILPEQNIGAHLLHHFTQNGQIGITALHTFYRTTIRKRNLPYNQFEFAGKQNLISGVHGDYRWRNFHFFGEGAFSLSRGTGLLTGSIVSLGKKWDATFLGRHYGRSFHTFYGNPISENTRPINENGVYGGLRFMPSRRWQFSGYIDRFWFPWLKFQVDAPSHGFDYYLHCLYKPGKRLNVYALLHEKHKQRNAPENKASAASLIMSVRRTAMINFEYEVPMLFSLRTRCQLGDSGPKNKQKSKGILVIQDLTWRFSRVELSGRIAWFNTDDYESRQYAYEKDMLYAFSIPAYSDLGTRHYLMLRYGISKKMKVWARWSQTNYRDLETISSGLNEIQGHKRSELKMQLMYELN
ncbi:ComEA family DNA-binding protein [Dyadobacter crusticola]|uniref:ComEA family DNA-binding protein n=1 Tax=Dyadobacter crusticola TaxID=292407 RepID=UPI0004E163DA|nr:helix-hairpin-helix domain-containing protein [Dyadobacter crusticola]